MSTQIIEEMSIEEITSNLVILMTYEQVTAFTTWVINAYVTYDRYISTVNAPAIEAYIKAHILTQEMRNVLRISQPYIGEKWGDVNIQWLLLNRRRVNAKIKYMKDKLGKIAFPIESTQARRDLRAAALSRRQAREAAEILQRQAEEADNVRVRQMYTNYFEAIRLKREKRRELEIVCITIQLSDVHALMEDDCAICLSTHKMTEACTINCGHQFGSACLAKWQQDTCPLCRTIIKETTVFVAPIVLTEADVLVLVA